MIKSVEPVLQILARVTLSYCRHHLAVLCNQMQKKKKKAILPKVRQSLQDQENP